MDEGDIREDPMGTINLLSNRHGCNLFTKIELLLSIDKYA